MADIQFLTETRTRFMLREIQNQLTSMPDGYELGVCIVKNSIEEFFIQTKWLLPNEKWNIETKYERFIK